MGCRWCGNRVGPGGVDRRECKFEVCGADGGDRSWLHWHSVGVRPAGRQRCFAADGGAVPRIPVGNCGIRRDDISAATNLSTVAAAVRAAGHTCFASIRERQYSERPTYSLRDRGGDAYCFLVDRCVLIAVQGVKELGLPRHGKLFTKRLDLVGEKFVDAPEIA